MSGPSRSGPGVIAAASGAVFVVLFVAALVLLRRAPHLDAPDAIYTAFYAHGGDTLFVAIGLYLVPLAGIAFLWHMTAIRALLDTLTPRPSGMAHGLNLLAGTIFVTMLFAGTAAVGAVAFAASRGGPATVDPGTARALTAVGYGLVFVFSVRGAGMFVLTTTTLLHAGGVLSRPWAVVGWLLGAFLLLSVTNNPAALLVFPLWVLLVSVAALRHRTPAPTPDAPATPTAPAPVVEH
ncbi:MAG: hypothetical protein QOE59_3116 [Actinomycetota bacterium]|nr:hypothetical protein [Actinomycetota bacterium]